uniref:Uncharacterized protein n=1 Tax=Rhizophora mucronata TaxID=61149 RepID=A0A2P2R2A1_RHIMU
MQRASADRDWLMLSLSLFSHANTGSWSFNVQ